MKHSVRAVLLSKRLRRATVFLHVVLVGCLCAQEELPKTPGMQQRHGVGILPEPQRVTVTDDRFTVDAQTALYAEGTPNDDFALPHLRSRIQQLTGYAPAVLAQPRAANIIVLRLSAESALADVPAGHARRDGYKLEVNRDRVTVTAAQPPGLLYGVQSFLQLLGQGGTSARGVEVLDWPDTAVRGIHMSTWYQMPRPSYFRHIFEQLSAYKLNAVVIELEDKIPYPEYPILSAPGGYTREEFMELEAYARRYHIDVIPLAQTLGHAAFIVKHKELQHLREVSFSSWQLCPAHPDFPNVARAVLDANMAVTPHSRYFHIGGDESWDLGKGDACRARWGDKASVESYRAWLTFVCDYLKERGRTVIAWDDMFFTNFSDEDMRHLPDNLIFMRWKYYPNIHHAFLTNFRKNLSPLDAMWRFHDMGFPVWVAPGAQVSAPVFANQAERVLNHATLIPSAVQKGLNGGAITTNWEDEGAHFETNWIGIAACAEYAWTAGSPPIPEFREKFFKTFHGPRAFGLEEIYATLSRPGALKGEDDRHWSKAYRAMALPPLPDKDLHVAADWLQKHGALLRQAREREPEYREALQLIEANLGRDIQNRYAMEVLRTCAKTFLHCTTGILRTGRMNELLLQAEQDHRNGDHAAALDRYQAIGRIIDDWLFDREQLDAETVRVWDQARFPKDFRHVPGARDRFVHRIDRSNCFENMTMDLTHILQVERRLGLFDYQQQLYERLRLFLRGNAEW